MEHSDSIWNDVKCGDDLSLSHVRADVIFKRLVRVSNYIIHGIPLITEHENQVRLFIFSNTYINFKVWQHNLFVQLKLVKICPQNIFLAGQLWVGDGPFGSIFDPQKTGYHCIAYTNNKVWRNFRMAVYNLKL